MSPWGDALDELASAVFGGKEGSRRLAPLLSRWERAVGTILEEDDLREVLHAVRTDWALCDAELAEGGTWLRRVLAGEVAGIEPRDSWRPLLGTHVGLFEVWPGAKAWLRDVRRGVSVGLEDPVRIEPVDGGGPGALWEVRIVIVKGRARMCRPPLPFPLAILDGLHEANRQRFTHGGAPVSLMRLRRQWLQFHRAPRAEPAAIFRLA